MRILLVTLGVVALLITAWLIYSAQSRRVADKHLVPKGYVGYISLFYDEPTKLPLPQINGYNVIRYDRKGECHTSSRYEEGYANDVYVYLAEDGTETAIGDDFIHDISISHEQDGQGNHITRDQDRMDIFIGSVSQLEVARKRRYMH